MCCEFARKTDQRKLQENKKILQRESVEVIKELIETLRKETSWYIYLTTGIIGSTSINKKDCNDHREPFNIYSAASAAMLDRSSTMLKVKI